MAYQPRSCTSLVSLVSSEVLVSSLKQRKANFALGSYSRSIRYLAGSSKIPMILCIRTSAHLYSIEQYKFPNTTSTAGGGGSGGGQPSYDDKGNFNSLNKSSRRRAIVDSDSSGGEEEKSYGSSHLENVADARAAAAEQTVGLLAFTSLRMTH